MVIEFYSGTEKFSPTQVPPSKSLNLCSHSRKLLYRKDRLYIRTFFKKKKTIKLNRRISAQRAGCAAPADGVRPHRDLAGGAAGAIPGTIPVDRGHESLSVRTVWRQPGPLPLHAGTGQALPGALVRPAAGPHRHATARQRPEPRRTGRPAAG